MSLENSFFYNDSPLVEEQILYLLKNYKKLGLSITELIEQMKTLNATVAEELEKMLASGELANIFTDLSDTFFNKYTKSASLTTVRQWRRIVNTGVNDVFTPNEQFAYCQGACMFEINGTTKVATINIKHTRKTTGVENNQINIFNFTNLNPVSTTVLPIGHGQDMCFANENGKNYLYIAHSSDNPSTSSNSITRVELDAQGNFTDNYDTHHFTGIQPYGIDFYKGVLYCFANRKVYTIDWDNSTSVLLCPLQFYNTPNGFLVDSRGIWLNSGENINLYKMNGELMWTYNIPTVSNDLFRLGEIESLSKLPNDDNIYIFTSEMVGVTSGLAQRALTQIFTVNPQSNYTPIASRTLERFTGQRATLHVMGSTETGTELITGADIINPDGSDTKPFKTCQEAIDYFSNLPQESLEIRMNGRGDDTFIINNGFNILIAPYHSAVSHLWLGGIFCENNGFVRLSANDYASIDVAQTATKQIGSLLPDTAAINCVNGTIMLSGAVTVYYGKTGYTPTTYTVRAYASNVFFTSDVSSSKNGFALSNLQGVAS